MSDEDIIIGDLRIKPIGDGRGWWLAGIAGLGPVLGFDNGLRVTDDGHKGISLRPAYQLVVAPLQNPQNPAQLYIQHELRPLMFFGTLDEVTINRDLLLKEVSKLSGAEREVLQEALRNCAKLVEAIRGAAVSSGAIVPATVGDLRHLKGGRKH